MKLHAGKANGSFVKIIDVDKATKEKPFKSSISLDTLLALQEPEIITGELVLETRARDFVEPVQLLHCPAKTMEINSNLSGWFLSILIFKLSDVEKSSSISYKSK